MLQKIQNLPEEKRKIIFWSIIIVVSLVMLSWWFENAKNKLKNLKKEDIFKEIKAPSFDEKFKGVQEVEIKENFNKLEKIIKEQK